MQALQAAYNYEHKAVPFSFGKLTAAQMPVWYHLPERSYYVGWSVSEGAFLYSTHPAYKTYIYRLEKKSYTVQTSPTDYRLAVPNYKNVAVPNTTAVQDKLSRSEFDKILEVKPKWTVLNDAYLLTVNTDFYPRDVDFKKAQVML